MPKHIQETTTFLNVDLILYLRSNLEPFVAALAERVCVLYIGRHRLIWEAHLELWPPPKSADAAIRRYSALIGTLPKAQRKLWDTARTRDFNIGVRAAMQPFVLEMVLGSETVEAASALKARIVFTIYAPEVIKKAIRRRRQETGSSS